MDERDKKAFDYVADLTKQLITLSTGIVTITLLLSKDFAGPRLIAVSAWTFYLLSTICGLWALMALAGTLAPLRGKKKKPHGGATKATSIPADGGDERLEIGSNVRTPSVLQILSFGLAILLTLAYVFATFASPPKPTALPTQECCCECKPIQTLK